MALVHSCRYQHHRHLFPTRWILTISPNPRIFFFSIAHCCVTWKSFWASGTLFLRCLAELLKARLARGGTFWKQRHRKELFWKKCLDEMQPQNRGGRRKAAVNTLLKKSVKVSEFLFHVNPVSAASVFKFSFFVYIFSLHRKKGETTEIPKCPNKFSPLAEVYQLFCG